VEGRQGCAACELDLCLGRPKQPDTRTAPAIEHKIRMIPA